MIRLQLNYGLLAIAMLLPMLAFGAFRVPPAWASIASWLSLAAMLAVGTSLSKLPSAGTWNAAAGQIAIQKRILVLLVIGGLLSTLRLFLVFEQFRLRVDLDTPLLVASAAVWIASVAYLIIGVVRLARAD